MTPRDMVISLRGLSLSTQTAACREFASNSSDYEALNNYSYRMVFADRSTGATMFSYKFFAHPNEGTVSVNFVFSGYETSVFLTPEEGETAVPFMKRLFAALKDLVCAEPIEGHFVKAFISSNNKRFWLVKPVDSPDVAEHNGEYFATEYSSEFYKTWTSRSDFKWIHANVFNYDEYKVYRGEYYVPELLAAIYHNSIPFNTVHSWMPTWLAGERYQTVLVDGETRFIQLERPLAAFFSKGIHSYSTRIETVIPEEQLFQKGKTDLYAKRPNDETPFLGWELEACTNESREGREDVAREFKQRMPFMVMAKSDSSIAPEGFETVSIPATLDFWKESPLADTLDAMRAAPFNMRSFKHSSCGFHVHVSRSALSLLDLQKLERFMHNPANRESLQLLAGRTSNTYQNYTDALFTNRKSLKPSNSNPFNTPSHHVVDGIEYFNNRPLRLTDEAKVQIPLQLVRDRYSAYGSRSLFQLLNTYWGDAVGYTSLNRVSGGLYNQIRFDEGVPDGYSAAEIRFLKTLCVASPFFRWKFDEFFSSIRDELPPITWSPEPQVVAPTSFGGVAKTKLPLGRKNSYRAAMENAKGVTGKGMQRYDVLNTKNPNTVEFRLFKGTMNPVTVFRYFEFVDAIVRFVGTTSASDAGLGFERFVQWVMLDAFNVTRYENLVAFFVEHKLYKRESIKRRFLPECKPEDGDLNVTPKPKPSLSEDENKPLYSLNTLAPAEAIAAAAPVADSYPFSDDDIDEADYEPDEENDSDYGGPNCNCDDCRRIRDND